MKKWLEKGKCIFCSQMLPLQANLPGCKVLGEGCHLVISQWCYHSVMWSCAVTAASQLPQTCSSSCPFITSVHWFYCPAPLLTVYTATRTAVTSPQLVTFKRIKLALVPSQVMGKRAPSHHARGNSSMYFHTFWHIFLTAEGLCCEWLHFAKQIKPKQSCHLTQHAYLNS